MVKEPGYFGGRSPPARRFAPLRRPLLVTLYVIHMNDLERDIVVRIADNKPELNLKEFLSSPEIGSREKTDIGFFACFSPLGNLRISPVCSLRALERPDVRKTAQ